MYDTLPPDILPPDTLPPDTLPPDTLPLLRHFNPRGNQTFLRLIISKRLLSMT